MTSKKTSRTQRADWFFFVEWIFHCNDAALLPLGPIRVYPDVPFRQLGEPGVRKTTEVP